MSRRIISPDEEEALEWQRALETERWLRSRLSEAGKQGSDHDCSQAAKEWFAHVASVMMTCARNGRGGSLTTSPPNELLAVISQFCDSLGRGIIPEPIAAVSIGRGRKPRGPTEARHVAIAAAYIQLAREGRIIDHTPFKTIQQAYGVTREAANKWGSEEVPFEIRNIWNGWDDAELSDWLRFQVHECGAIYKDHGRSSAAVHRRDPRRKV